VSVRDYQSLICVTGDELYDYLIKNGRLSVQKTKRIFTQLVGAVSYVHLNNCVHRDLKLENIMLDKNENVCRLTWRVARASRLIWELAG